MFSVAVDVESLSTLEAVSDAVSDAVDTTVSMLGLALLGVWAR
jgi:hypothetical protein